MWSELADRDPSLLEHFERFLSGVTAELKQSQHDKERLEIHMKRSVRVTHSKRVNLVGSRESMCFSEEGLMVLFPGRWINTTER